MTTTNKTNAVNTPPPMMQTYFKDIEIMQPTIGTVAAAIEMLDKMGVSYDLDENTSIPRLITPYTCDLAWGIRLDTLKAQVTYMQAMEEWFNNLAAPTMQDIEAYLWAYPRTHRFRTLENIDFSHLTDDWHRHVGDFILSVYIDTEIFDAEFAAEWREYLVQYKSCFAHTFEEFDDTKIYTLYHGIEYDHDDYADGEYIANAWTLKFTTAEFFAARFAKDVSMQPSRGILKIKLSGLEIKEQALFYTDDRGESEVYLHDPYMYATETLA